MEAIWLPDEIKSIVRGKPYPRQPLAEGQDSCAADSGILYGGQKGVLPYVENSWENAV